MDKLNSESWEHDVIAMAYHKCLEKMEEFNKKDTDELGVDEYKVYKDCAETMTYLKGLCKE